ncbi:MAG TPA: hypothetical protein VGM90_20530 [Kofleriaceae bacterium]|jgi:hypothetical protein
MRRLFPALLCALAACGGSQPPPPSGPPPTNTCADYGKAAFDSLSAALDTYRACQTDADCTTVAFGASCFDACSRAVAIGDKEAFLAAVEDINHTQCQAFQNAGCPKPEVPPCAPPSTAVCKAGRCE